ncbi:myb/SANT-like DNA-binding domain-containing protein 3 [Anabrus simplex]|uniref:myb/SANT-like DNA-binding domain-containing protein 3 n=1 Tax=Anabrus simplex TaxID=316456 RepID=UPI0035A38F4E
MASEAKRNRSSNFFSFEKELLIELVSKNREVIECKRTDGLRIREKDEAWEKVREGFNSNPNVTSRTAKQLRQFYINIKRLAKKAKEEERLERFKTGGGPYTPTATKIDERVLSLIEDQIKPCSNVYDCDAVYYGDAEIVEVVDEDEDLSVVAAVQQNEPSLVASTPPKATTHLESTRLDIISPQATPKTTKDKTCAETKQSTRSNKASRCRNNIAALAESRTSLCEKEMKLIEEKYKQEIQLIEMRKETERLKQQTEKLQQEATKEKLLYLKEKRRRIAKDCD